MIIENLGNYFFSVEIEITSKTKEIFKKKKIYTTLISKATALSLGEEIKHERRNLKASYLAK